MCEYCIYVSNAKVNMLYDQIDKTNKQVEKEYKFGTNFGIASGEYAVKKNDIVTQYDKIAKIEDELILEDEVGSIRDNKDYIKDTVLLGWETTKDLTLWGNQIYDKKNDTLYVIELFGSPQNIVGNHLAGEFRTHSIYPFFVECAKDMLFKEREKPNKYFEDLGQNDIQQMQTVGYQPAIWELLEGMTYHFTGYKNSYKFFARVLYREAFSNEYRAQHLSFAPLLTPADKTVYILATPLYVVLNDNHDSRIEKVDNRNYLSVNVSQLKKEFESSRSFGRAFKKIVNELKNCGLYAEAKEAEDRVEQQSVFERRDEEAMEMAWKIISDYIIDK